MKYGRVTEPIPEKELKYLLRDAELAREQEVRKALRQRALERDAEGTQCANSGGVVAAPASRQQRHWYTRSLMWHIAKKRFDSAHDGNLGSISALAPEEYRACLDAVNTYLKDNKCLREQGGVQTVERDAGPMSAADQGFGVTTRCGDG